MSVCLKNAFNIYWYESLRSNENNNDNNSENNRQNHTKELVFLVVAKHMLFDLLRLTEPISLID